jgi:hypothetical protein
MIAGEEVDVFARRKWIPLHDPIQAFVRVRTTFEPSS